MKNKIFVKNKEINVNKSLFLKRITFFFTLLVLTLHLTTAQVGSDQYKPYLHKPTVKEAPELQTFGSYQTNLFPGAGTYTYLIETVPGTNGLQPLISLFYNSQSALQRPGMLGSGWSMTQGFISRDINHTLSDISDDFFIMSLGDNKI